MPTPWLSTRVEVALMSHLVAFRRVVRLGVLAIADAVEAFVLSRGEDLAFAHGVLHPTGLGSSDITRTVTNA